MLGCDQTAYTYGRAYSQMANKGPNQKAVEGRAGHEHEIYVAGNRNNCNHPKAFGWVAAVYMVSFIVIGSMVLITLFIGIVATSMEEAKSYQKKEAAEEFSNVSTAKNLGLMPPMAVKQPIHVQLLRAIFTSLDTNGNNVLDNDDFKPVLNLLPLVTRGAEARAVIAKMDQDQVRIFKLQAANRRGPAASAHQGKPMRHGLDAKLASVEKLANFASSSRGSFSDPNELEGGSSSSSSGGDPRADLKRHSLELCRLMEAGARDADCPTSADLDLVLHVLDEYYRQVWSFLEFMVVVDFLHRVETDVTLLRIVRAANPFTAQELAASALAGGTFGIHASMGRAEGAAAAGAAAAGAAAAGAAAAGAAGRGQDDQGGKDEEARDGRDEGGKLRAGVGRPGAARSQRRGGQRDGQQRHAVPAQQGQPQPGKQQGKTHWPAQQQQRVDGVGRRGVGERAVAGARGRPRQERRS
jgi:hypothetical protein